MLYKRLRLQRRLSLYGRRLCSRHRNRRTIESRTNVAKYFNGHVPGPGEADEDASSQGFLGRSSVDVLGALSLILRGMSRTPGILSS